MSALILTAAVALVDYVATDRDPKETKEQCLVIALTKPVVDQKEVDVCETMP